MQRIGLIALAGGIWLSVGCANAEPEPEPVPAGTTPANGWFVACEDRECGVLAGNVLCGTCPGQRWCDDAIGQCTVLSGVTVDAGQVLADGTPRMTMPMVVAPGFSQGLIQVVSESALGPLSADLHLESSTGWSVKPASTAPTGFYVRYDHLSHLPGDGWVPPTAVVRLMLSQQGLSKHVSVRQPVAFRGAEVVPFESQSLRWPPPFVAELALAPLATGAWIAIDSLSLQGPPAAAFEMDLPGQGPVVFMDQPGSQALDPPLILEGPTTARVVISDYDRSDDYPAASYLSTDLQFGWQEFVVAAAHRAFEVHHHDCFTAVSAKNGGFFDPDEWTYLAGDEVALQGEARGPLADQLGQEAFAASWQIQWPDDRVTEVGADPALKFTPVTVGPHTASLQMTAPGVTCPADTIRVWVEPPHRVHVEVLAEAPLSTYLAWEWSSGTCAAEVSPCYEGGEVAVLDNAAMNHRPLVAQATAEAPQELWIHSGVPQEVTVWVWRADLPGPLYKHVVLKAGPTVLGWTEGVDHFAWGAP